jgi:hypothetical protein
LLTPSWRLPALIWLLALHRTDAAARWSSWFVAYAAMALGCDTPILEALVPTCAAAVRRAALAGPPSRWRRWHAWPLLQEDADDRAAERARDACLVVQAVLARAWQRVLGATAPPNVDQIALQCALRLSVAAVPDQLPHLLAHYAAQLLGSYGGTGLLKNGALYVLIGVAMQALEGVALLGNPNRNH